MLMSTQNKKKSFLTPNEVAKLLMVSPVTVRQWAQKGQLKAETTLGGHRRFMYQEVVRFAKTHGLAFNTEQDEIKVLIVDDDEQLSKFLNELLIAKNKDVVVESVNNGFDAGTKIYSFSPTIVLLDLMMPDINGIEVCRRIKSDPSTRAMRIISMTGFHTPENVEKILNAGAEVCLAKPLNTQLLLDEIGLIIND